MVTSSSFDSVNYSTYSPETSVCASPEVRLPPHELNWGTPHPSVYDWGKRLVDIVGGFIGLCLTALIFIPIAIAIQIDNPGPIFYSQIRYGYRGRAFRIWKFRSMVTNADRLKSLVKNEAKGLIFKNEDDPRTTRVGRFLRRTSLDEFPQFWNVFKGEMSLVGTRPPVGEEVAYYQPHHWQRLAVKPGLTGLWQACGRSTINDFEQIVAMDLEYQRRWSRAFDLQLILKTIESVLRSRGAY